jgi:nitrite reductase/ring-hydroxylating ferredoxin subunit
MHFWRYDARTGEGLDHNGAALRRLGMKQEDGGIWIEIGD